VTTADSTWAKLSEIVARTRFMLLDFDGPVCSIFAGLPAPEVAEELRKLFTPEQLTDTAKNTPDPIEVFIQAAEVSPELAARVEAEMTDLEVTAATTAKPTPYVHEVLAGCRESGRTVAVVSNNSARAVNAYLDRHGLSYGIALVVARTSHDPALLKPSPHLLEIAVEKLAADPAATALVGDSLTDIEAAHRAGIASIGYANKPGKHEAMTELQAGAVITSMSDLALSLRAHPVHHLALS
jgi:HAD superfamily hydrolase (TIGR01662 family)